MVILKIDFAQETIAFAASDNVLHLSRTQRCEMFLSVLNQCIVHPRPFKVRQRRRALAPDPVPVVLVWIWICSQVKNSTSVEIERFYGGLCYQITVAESSLRASMRGSGSAPTRPLTTTNGCICGNLFPQLGKCHFASRLRGFERFFPSANLIGRHVQARRRVT